MLDKHETELLKRVAALRDASQQKGEWVFQEWEMIPGPGRDDFRIVYQSHAEYARAVENFVSGSPTTIDGWIVPLHKHPELTLEGVQYAIADAVNVSCEAFERIEEDRHRRIYYHPLFGRTRWEWALQTQFLTCKHISEPAVTLRLRRDMQETYIVHI
jgi:hypothetical protein